MSGGFGSPRPANAANAAAGVALSTVSPLSSRYAWNVPVAFLFLLFSFFSSPLPTSYSMMIFRSALDSSLSWWQTIKLKTGTL